MNINVYTESTPNPATMKFIVNKLLINGSVDFATRESAEKSPFAKELFKFSFVNGVFFASNFVTVNAGVQLIYDDKTKIPYVNNNGVSGYHTALQVKQVLGAGFTYKF